MNDERFLNQFEALELPPAEFNHTAHVRLAWIYLRRHSLPEAMSRFRDSLQRFAAKHGAAGVYHETITFAYLLLIHDRLQRQDEEPASWSRFAELNSDLIQNGKEVLSHWYREETLSSAKAKTCFQLPDQPRLSAGSAIAGQRVG